MKSSWQELGSIIHPQMLLVHNSFFMFMFDVYNILFCKEGHGVLFAQQKMLTEKS